MDLFEDVKSRAATEVILITGHASIESSIDALRLGAADYLIKPVNVRQLRAILSRVARPADLKSEIGLLRDELRSLGRFGRLLGTSPPMQRVYDQIARVAPTAATVLITGESGTGKELVAQTLHDLSRRRKQPFLPVNCGAISPQLIESEMFGHEKGSFTGALREHKGYFERASGGTVLLDEISEMPIELQVKLLRVLESGTFMRVGSGREVEVGALSPPATAILTRRSPRASLREDRIGCASSAAAPLARAGRRRRTAANHFPEELNRAESTNKTFAPATLSVFAHDWPGNVRELKNVVHRACIMADDVIEPNCVPPNSAAPDRPPSVFRCASAARSPTSSARSILATLEQWRYREKAATMLGISLKTLYNRLREYQAQTEPASNAQAVQLPRIPWPTKRIDPGGCVAAVSFNPGRCNSYLLRHRMRALGSAFGTEVARLMREAVGIQRGS
jgi:DNA-binding NtrC family response regulator